MLLQTNRIQEILHAVAAITDTHIPRRLAARSVHTGWDAIDAALAPTDSTGGLAFAAIHEWIAGASGSHPGNTPLAVLIHLARRALAAAGPTPGLIVWIGDRCRPYAPALNLPAHPHLLDHSIFLSPPNREDRIWAIDTALRSPAVTAVIADAAGIRMTESRRFQLAAAAGGTLGLLVRPPAELGEISAARTRWRIHPTTTAPPSRPSSRFPLPHPQWVIQLLRCKGLRPLTEDARRWVVRLNHETGSVCLAPDAPDRHRASDGSHIGTPNTRIA